MEPWKPEGHPQNEVVVRIIGDVAVSYTEAGYFTIVDGILLPTWFFLPLRTRLRSAGLDVITVILRPSLSVCQSRVAGGAPDRFADAEVVEQIWRGFADLGTLERHVIDNGAQLPGATADAVIRDHVRSVAR